MIASAYATVICTPEFAEGSGLSIAKLPIGPHEGFKHESWIVCDNLHSVRKADLTNFVGSLSRSKLAELDEALRIALGLS